MSFGNICYHQVDWHPY